MKVTNKISYLFFPLLLGLIIYLNLLHYEKHQNFPESEEIKTSEKHIETVQEKLDSLALQYKKLEAKKQTIRYVYLKGKETVKYITRKRIEKYEDSLCQKDVWFLQNQLVHSDSLIQIQDSQIINFTNRVYFSENILREKDKQIYILLHRKTVNKDWGIGLTAGYGTDFKTFSPFIGIGISRQIVKF